MSFGLCFFANLISFELDNCNDILYYLFFFVRSVSVFVPDPLVTANKLTQDPDDKNEDDNVGSSIEVTKKTSVCVTPHWLVLTQPPYKNKRDYKGGTNDKTNDSHTHETVVSINDDYSVKRNLDEENKNATDD